MAFAGTEPRLADIRVLLASELKRRRELIERAGREVAAFSDAVERWRSYRAAQLSRQQDRA